MLKTKKGFKETGIEVPELNFISRETVEAVDGKKEEPSLKDAIPNGYKLNPQYIEKKTKRVQLLFQPSVYEKAKTAAMENGISFNELCHRAVEEYLKGV